MKILRYEHDRLPTEHSWREALKFYFNQLKFFLFVAIIGWSAIDMSLAFIRGYFDVISWVAVICFIISGLFLIFRLVTIIGALTPKPHDTKAIIYEQWRTVDLQKASQQEATKQFAKALVSLVFPKYLKGFDTISAVFFDRVDMPIFANTGSPVGGTGFGGVGSLGAIQALSFAFLVVQYIKGTAKDNSTAINERVHQFVEDSKAREQLLQFAHQLGLDNNTAKELIDTTIELLKRSNKAELYGIENE